MATILELVNTGKLEKYDPELEYDEQEERYVYFLPSVLVRMLDELPTYVSNWKLEDSPQTQFDQLMEVFCSGEPLTFDWMFKPLKHRQEGVWELKTPDLRLFGWFPVKDCFIVGAVDTAFNIKSYNLYEGHANVVAHLRNQLELNEPKFISGKEPYDVVSNFDFP
jgi:hypothetical protein